MNAGRWMIFVGVLLAVVLVSVVPVAAAPAVQGQIWHQVKPGETLFSIGRLYGVSPWAIANANGLSNPNIIWVGQKLLIPGITTTPTPTPTPTPSPTPSPTPVPCGSSYTVQWGDTLWAIGQRYGVSPWSIAAVNGIYNLNRIYIGQVLWIPCR